MATNYNYFGNLVTNGLVLDLDAAKLDSYPGSGTTWRDISGNNLTGSLVNGPTFSGIGKSASIVFDGTNDYINIPGISFPVSSSFTLNSWVYFASGSGQWPMIANAGNLNMLFGIQIGTGAYTGFNLFLGSTTLQTSNIGRPLFDKWYHVVGNYDGSVARLYLNGSPTSVSSPAVFPGASGFTLANGSAGGNSYWKGNIPSTQVYNRALSQFEVWQNFNALKGRYGIPDIVTNGLALNLDAGNPYSYLSGSSGTTWTNTVAVSSSISGTLVNGPVYANGAILFDGVDDRIGTNYSPTSYVNTTQIIWYKWDGVNQLKVLSYFGSSGANGFGLIINNGSNSNITGSRVSVLYGGAYYNALNTGSLYAQLVSNQWCQLTLTRDSSTTTLYQNGNLIGSTSRTPTTAATYNFSYGDITVGAAGNVSNMQFYTRVLSQAEITQNFNALRGRYGI